MSKENQNNDQDKPFNAELFYEGTNEGGAFQQDNDNTIIDDDDPPTGDSLDNQDNPDNEDLTDEEKQQLEELKGKKDKPAPKKDADGNDIVDDDDLTEEELRKKALGEDGAPAPVVKIDLEAKALAADLGFTFEADKEVSLDDIKTEVKRLRELNTTDDEDVKTLKLLKATKPGATIADYAKEFVPPQAALLAMDDRTLMVNYLTAVEKKTDEDARKEVADMINDGNIKEKTEAIRTALAEKAKEFTEGKTKEVNALKEQYNRRVSERQKAVFEAMNSNESKVFGGTIKLKNKDKLLVMDALKNGKLDEMVKDPNSVVEALLFKLKGKEIMSVWEKQGFEQGKGYVLEDLANSDVKPVKRGEGKSTPGLITASEW